MQPTIILLLAIESLSAQPGRFGLPACDAPDQQLATRTAFTICLSNTHKVPIWTAYQLTPEMLEAILTGVLFDCDSIQHIGPNQIAVPCATYKVAISIKGTTRSAYAVVLPNQPAATQQTVSICDVETRSGLDFFSSLPPTNKTLSNPPERPSAAR